MSESRMEANSIPMARSIAGDAPRLVNALAMLLLVGVVLAAAMIIVRRAAGALDTPLSPLALVSTGVIVATAAAGVRLSTQYHSTALVHWLAGSAALALAIGVSLPGSSVVGLSVLWIAVIAEEAWSWWRWRASRRIDVRARRQLDGGRGRRLETSIQSGTRTLPLAEPSPFAGDVVQKLIRTQADGVDRIQGWLKARLAESERNATLHVAFCPPFDEAPTLTVVQTNGPECRIKTGQLLSYGVRLELKRVLAEAEQAVVVIEFSAQAPYRSAS
jgi:hypothetical protein